MEDSKLRLTLLLIISCAVSGYNSNTETAQTAKSNLEERHGVKVVTVGGDLSVPQNVQALFQASEVHVTPAGIHNRTLALLELFLAMCVTKGYMRCICVGSVIISLHGWAVTDGLGCPFRIILVDA